MNCAFLGRVVDVHENEFVSKKDNKKIKYVSVSIIDEDAFLDSDRIFALRLSSEKGKVVETGKTYKFNGNLTTDRGVLKFRCDSAELKESK